MSVHPVTWHAAYRLKDPAKPQHPKHQPLNPVLLGGSWVVIIGVISRVTIVATQFRGLITPLITTHEPPSGATHDAMSQPPYRGFRNQNGVLGIQNDSPKP